MELVEIIREVELFKGLSPSQLSEIAELCQPKEMESGETLVKEGEQGKEFYLITAGAVEVLIKTSGGSPHRMVTLGKGQLIGEMTLVDEGRRSATVRAVQTPTTVQAVENAAFIQLCRQNTDIGYLVMRNMAADLSFKVRHLNLLVQG